MSRLYQDDYGFEPWMQGQQAGALRSAIRGNRGQQFLRDLVAALNALPEPKLSAGALEDEETGCCCAFGAVRRYRGTDAVPLYFDPQEKDLDPPHFVEPFNVATALAWEVVEANEGRSVSNSEAAMRQRWSSVRAWAARQLLPQAGGSGGEAVSTLEQTIYADPSIGFTVTAWQHEVTRCWSVRFLRRNTDLNQISHWIPGRGWNCSRLRPSALPLIPPAALADVEAWLAEQVPGVGGGKP